MPLVTVEELYDEFREELGDDTSTTDDGKPTDADCLWKDKAVFRYMHDAQFQVARRARPIADVIDVAIKAGTAEYSLPDYVIHVRRCKYASSGREINVVNNNDPLSVEFDRWDYGSASWRLLPEDVAGTPVEATFDEKDYKFRLVPYPTLDDSLRLYCFRGPRQLICELNSPLELNHQETRRAILLWMKKRAYEKHDADIRNEGYSDKYAKEFTEEIVKLKREVNARRRRPGTVQYGGLRDRHPRP